MCLELALEVCPQSLNVVLFCLFLQLNNAQLLGRVIESQRQTLSGANS